jgi:hypothetical protein
MVLAGEERLHLKRELMNNNSHTTLSSYLSLSPSSPIGWLCLTLCCLTDPFLHNFCLFLEDGKSFPVKAT